MTTEQLNNNTEFNFNDVKVPKTMNGIHNLKLVATENLRTIEYIDQRTNAPTQSKVLDFIFQVDDSEQIKIQIFTESLPMFFKCNQKAFSTSTTGQALIDFLKADNHAFYITEELKGMYLNYSINWDKTLKNALIK